MSYGYYQLQEEIKKLKAQRQYGFKSADERWAVKNKIAELTQRCETEYPLEYYEDMYRTYSARSFALSVQKSDRAKMSGTCTYFMPKTDEEIYVEEQLAKYRTLLENAKQQQRS